MYSPTFVIKGSDFVRDIVAKDYRTANVFKKYSIDFCCGGKWTLQQACDARELDINTVQASLSNAIRNINVSNTLRFDEWKIDFLIDYIQNVHHEYIKQHLPKLKTDLEQFVEGHKRKYAYLLEVQPVFDEFYTTLLPHIEQEESTIFPYLRQITNAWYKKEPYGALLVKTLRKPVEKIITNEHAKLREIIHQLRHLTNHYSSPENACLTHKVIMQQLQEFDNDLVQHIHLENNVLFPKIMRIEKELLSSSLLL